MNLNVQNKIKLILEYSLYLFVFILPWQTRWIIKAGNINGAYSEYSTISLYATDILLVVLLISFLFLHIRRHQTVKPSLNNFISLGSEKLKIPYIWPLIAGLEIAIFVSIFVAVDKSVALEKYLWFLMGVGLFSIVLLADYSRTKLYLGMLAGIFIQAVLGVWQFLNQTSFSFKWLGMATHDPTTLGVSVVEATDSAGLMERWLRAYGGLDHPNILGGLLAAGILLVIYLMVFKGRRGVKQQSGPFLPIQVTKNNKFYSIAIIIFIIISTIALFFTFSRTAWLGLGLSITLMLVWSVMRRDWRAQKSLLQVVLVLGIIGFIFLNLFSNLVLTRLEAKTRLESVSMNERLDSIATAQDLIKNNWLFGVGIGNYTAAVQAELIPDQPSWFYQPVHNVYLLLGAEIGIIGLLFFISIGVYAFYFCWTRIKQVQTQFYLLTLFVAIVLMMLFDHWWWSLHFGVLFFWLIIGVLFKETQLDKKQKIVL